MKIEESMKNVLIPFCGLIEEENAVKAKDKRVCNIKIHF